MTDPSDYDTSKLAPLVPVATVIRAIDPDDIEGWNEDEKRWVLASGAMDSKQLTPGLRSGYGYSLYVTSLLCARCNAQSGREVQFMQQHAHQHQCKPTWQNGIVVKVEVSQLLALGFGAGESRDDGTCDETRAAHASLWKDPSWSKGRTRVARDAALKLFGENAVYEDAVRLQQKGTTRLSAPPPTPTGPRSGRPPNGNSTP